MAAPIVANYSEDPVDALLASTRQLRALTLMTTGLGLDGFHDLEDRDVGEIMHMFSELALKANTAAADVCEALEKAGARCKKLGELKERARGRAGKGD